jgi:hypothetical protein
MKRYTIQLQLRDGTSDADHLRKSLGASLSITTHLTSFACIDSENNMYSAEVESKAEQRELVRILKGLEKRLAISRMGMGYR